eukprot:Selendium_serpulae@DN152_c0_g1_i3.p1
MSSDHFGPHHLTEDCRMTDVKMEKTEEEIEHCLMDPEPHKQSAKDLEARRPSTPAAGAESLACLRCCRRIMHRSCLARWATEYDRFVCPVCMQPTTIPIREAPPGRMTSRLLPPGVLQLPGFESFRTVIIIYELPSGNVARGPYQGASRVTVLPATDEGLKALTLLQRLFALGYLFDVGRSRTTGADHTVVYREGVSHKTSINAGRFGFPDRMYPLRLLQQLREIGGPLIDGSSENDSVEQAQSFTVRVTLA